MKAKFLLLSLALVFSFTNSHAFKISDITKGADAITGGSDLLSMGTDLLSSFKGNKQAMDAATGLLDSFKAEDYLGGFKYFDKIKAAGLKPSQLKTWNDVKNPLSAYVLDKNFSFKDSNLTDLVSKASSSLQVNDVDSATKYLGQLKDAATLTDGQKDLLGEITANAPLLTK